MSQRQDDKQASRNAEKMKHLYAMIKAKYGVICVTSSEEGRFLRVLQNAIDTGEMGQEASTIKTWSASEGLNAFEIGRKKAIKSATTTELKSALGEVIAAPPEGTIYVFRDVHLALGDKARNQAESVSVISQLRDCARLLRSRSNTLIMLSANFPLPPELEKEVATFDFPLPDETDMKSLVKSAYQAGVANFGEKNTDPYSEELVGEVARACLGMTYIEAEDALTLAMHEYSGFGARLIPSIHASKQAAIRRVGCLEAIPVTYGMESVGGLGNLKDWVRKRKNVFSDKARAFGVEPPKGLMTLGVPGGGKGLAARAVAAEWSIPLIRMDMGAVMGMWLGESEGNMRKALKIAEALAPCVLWVDEVEKSLGGGNGGKHETSNRVFGNLLTWMQEKEASVILYFTANDITMLPPELLRKGRIDELFFVDVPSEKDRKEILSIHLRKRRRNPAEFDMAALAAASRGFVGAEIEQGIQEAIIDAFSDGAPNVTTAHIQAAFARTQPLIQVQPEQMARLREFIKKGRAVRASFDLPDDGDLSEPARPAETQPPPVRMSIRREPAGRKPEI